MALPGRPQAMLRCSPSAPPPAAFQPIAPGAPGATGDGPRNGPRRMEFAWRYGLGDLESKLSLMGLSTILSKGVLGSLKDTPPEDEQFEPEVMMVWLEDDFPLKRGPVFSGSNC